MTSLRPSGLANGCALADDGPARITARGGIVGSRATRPADRSVYRSIPSPTEQTYKPNNAMDSCRTKRQLISTTKAAELLNVSPNTARSLIVDGRFKGYKVGRLIKLDTAEIEAFLDRVAIE